MLLLLCTVWKFQDFPATQILCEIKSDYYNAPKTPILSNLAALSFDIFWGEFLTFFKNQNSKLPKLSKEQFLTSRN